MATGDRGSPGETGILISLLALLVVASFAFATGQGEGKAAGKVTQIKYWALFGGSDSEIMELMVKNANAWRRQIFRCVSQMLPRPLTARPSTEAPNASL